MTFLSENAVPLLALALMALSLGAGLSAVAWLRHAEEKERHKGPR